jgi:hypothetical protein
VPLVCRDSVGPVVYNGPMRRAVGGPVAVLTVAAVVVGAVAAADAAPKKQSPAKYAKTVCGTYSQLEGAFRQFADGIGTLDPSNSTAYELQATAKTDALLGTVKAAEATLQAVYPDVARGKQVGVLLTSNASEIDTAVTAALQQVQSGGAAAVVQFQVAIQTLGTKLTDPFSQVKDRNLINAFQKEKTCKDVVHVVRT